METERVPETARHFMADGEATLFGHGRESLEIELPDDVPLPAGVCGAIRPRVEHVVEDADRVDQVHDVPGVPQGVGRRLRGDDGVVRVEVEFPGTPIAIEDFLERRLVKEDLFAVDVVPRLAQGRFEAVVQDFGAPVP